MTPAGLDVVSPDLLVSSLYWMARLNPRTDYLNSSPSPQPSITLKNFFHSPSTRVVGSSGTPSAQIARQGDPSDGDGGGGLAMNERSRQLPLGSARRRRPHAAQDAQEVNAPRARGAQPGRG